MKTSKIFFTKHIIYIYTEHRWPMQIFKMEIEFTERIDHLKELSFGG